jgi:hypothetical protein
VTSCTKTCTVIIFESTNVEVSSRSASYFARNRNSGATAQYGTPQEVQKLPELSAVTHTVPLAGLVTSSQWQELSPSSSSETAAQQKEQQQQTDENAANSNSDAKGCKSAALTNDQHVPDVVYSKGTRARKAKERDQFLESQQQQGESHQLRSAPQWRRSRMGSM